MREKKKQSHADEFGFKGICGSDDTLYPLSIRNILSG